MAALSCADCKMEIKVRTLIIGSGCAGLNAADCLYNEGERDILITTEGLMLGTSRNTGSDKQTYFRMSLSGDEGDSVGLVAQTLKRPDTDGDTALCEAACSAGGFLKLASLGVPFPQNEFGEYVGYRTDHDTHLRASSAGPLTSKFMTEALEKSVRSKGIKILENVLIYRLNTNSEGICGALGIKLDTKEFVRFACAHVILCTGGPAHIYASRVYPESQHGACSLALDCGARAQNLDMWQYGLASVDFRWNVSGSYQQVLPKYISVDENGVEREFLDETLSVKEKLKLCFLKGYEWPFDPDKREGSSKIDLLVKREEDLGRRVYMDFRCDPSGFSTENLSEEAYSYLKNSNSLMEIPINRLKSMNAPAIQLYLSHGIDIEKEPLRVSVCAQHHNGGISVDANWLSSIPGLYVCGEAAGTFGAKRPGGSALNSTQAGSLRAARHIAYSKRKTPEQLPEFVPPYVIDGNTAALTGYFQNKMTCFAAFERSKEGIKELLRELSNLHEVPCNDISDADLYAKIMLTDIVHTQKAVLGAMLLRLESPEERVLVTEGNVSSYRDGRPIPDRDLWFESVWAKQRKLMEEKQ